MSRPMVLRYGSGYDPFCYILPTEDNALFIIYLDYIAILDASWSGIHRIYPDRHSYR